MTRSLSLPIALVLCASAAGQGFRTAPPSGPTGAVARRAVAVFLGNPGGFGEVRLYDEASGVELDHPPLVDLRLLPLDFVGRNDLESLLPDRARLRSMPGNGTSVVLPRERGALLRFERTHPSGASFGFLWVRRDGMLEIVGERPGVGALGTDDPWLARIAVGPAGEGFLAATRVSAGGDLVLFELRERTERTLTAGLPPRSFSSAGMWLHTEWGLAAGDEGVLRFGRNAGAARPVPFDGATPAHFSGEVAVSRNRAFAVTTAGEAADLLDVWVLGATGAARRVSADPGPVTPAGFLPEHHLGPYLAVDGAGTCAAWRVDLVMEREVFLGRVEAVPAPTQVSGDFFFADTMNEVGLLGIYDPGTLRMTLGERDTGDPVDFLENTDVYEVALDATGTPSFANLTRTSGDAQAPFKVTGTIEPKAMRWVPDAQRVFVHDGDAERLLAIDPHQPDAVHAPARPST